MNRLFNFPVFAFLSLMALLFLFSSWLSHLSVARAMLEYGKAIDWAAVEKATLINPNAVGLFTDPTGIKVPMIDQRVDFSVGTPLKEVMRKLRVVPSYPKDHVHSRFDIKTCYGPGPRRTLQPTKQFSPGRLLPWAGTSVRCVCVTPSVYRRRRSVCP